VPLNKISMICPAGGRSIAGNNQDHHVVGLMGLLLSLSTRGTYFSPCPDRHVILKEHVRPEAGEESRRNIT
jgi:hypothetical protein